MIERKEHEIGEKDQWLYSNLRIKCAGTTERRQSVSSLMYSSGPPTSAAPRKLTGKIRVDGEGGKLRVFFQYTSKEENTEEIQNYFRI